MTSPNINPIRNVASRPPFLTGSLFRLGKFKLITWHAQDESGRHHKSFCFGTLGIRVYFRIRNIVQNISLPVQNINSRDVINIVMAGQSTPIFCICIGNYKFHFSRILVLESQNHWLHLFAGRSFSGGEFKKYRAVSPLGFLQFFSRVRRYGKLSFYSSLFTAPGLIRHRLDVWYRKNKTNSQLPVKHSIFAAD